MPCSRCLRVFTFILVLFIVSCGSQGYDGQGSRTLFDFEEDWELNFLRWRCGTLMEQDTRHATSGLHSLRVEMYTNVEYPGVTCIFEKGCRGGKRLLVDIFNPGEQDLLLSYRIDDRKENPPYGDRANGRFVARPGANVFAVDLAGLVTSDGKRRMDASGITRLGIFVHRPVKPIAFYMDNVRLESN